MSDILNPDALSDLEDTGLERKSDDALVEEEASPETTSDNDGIHPDVHHVAGHDNPHPKDSLYIKVAVVLAVLTALETATYWVDLGSAHTPVLLAMMVVKFVLVILFFMHLKFDSKVFGAMFYIGIVLTMMVYLGVLFAMRVF